MSEIKIPKEIADRLQKRVDESNGEFNTVEEYVNYILGQVVERLEAESNEHDEEVYSEEDEKKVKEKLKALGYLD
ncbi:CopG family transcriptional regulator [Candidatus Woesearchaeota archaeon]|nr:CopG family transcriptional regulator [Candidatus Woesearchaeota archaeon]